MTEIARMDLISGDPGSDISSLVGVLDAGLVPVSGTSDLTDTRQGVLWGGSLDGSYLVTMQADIPDQESDPGDTVSALEFGSDELAHVIGASEAMCPGWRPWFVFPDEYALRRVWERCTVPMGLSEWVAVPLLRPGTLPGEPRIVMAEILDPSGLRVVLVSGVRDQSSGLHQCVHHSAEPDGIRAWYADRLEIDVPTCFDAMTTWRPVYLGFNQSDSLGAASQLGTRIDIGADGFSWTSPSGIVTGFKTGFKNSPSSD
jgi:hypothetical protein